jgi:hypothetical protein
MAQTDLVCSKCVGRQTVNNIVMTVQRHVLVTTVGYRLTGHWHIQGGQSLFPRVYIHRSVYGHV